LQDVRISSSLDGEPTADVTLAVDGVVHTVKSSGDGVIDACYQALKRAAGLDPKLDRYQVKAITGGTDAIGDVTCVLRFGDQVVRGHGAHTDIIMASAQAYVDAFNRYDYRYGGRHGRRGEDSTQREVGP